MSTAPDTNDVMRLCSEQPDRQLAEILQHFPGHEEHVARMFFAARAPTTRPIPVGERADGIGPYDRLRALGSGAQGDVFLARDTRSQRLVALKVLRGTPTPHAIERLRREAQAIARLRHPAIAEVLDVDFAGPVPYLATRYVDGLSLRDARATNTGALFATSETPLPATALRWFERVARAVHAVHSAGIVHRDLHPGNLILAANGEPVVLDFGTARIDGAPSITLTGLALGSARYAAPEVLRGARADRRSDVFSLGAILFECACPSGSAADLPGGVTNVASPPLRAVLQKAVAARPHERFATALELAEELRRIRAGEPIHTGHSSALARAWRSAVHNPWPAAAGVLLLAALVIVSLSLITTVAMQRRLEESADHGRVLITGLVSESSEPATDRLSRGNRTGSGATSNQLVAGVELEIGRVLRRAGRLDQARVHLLAASQNPLAGAQAAFELALIDFDGDAERAPPIVMPSPTDNGAMARFQGGLALLQRGEVDPALQALAAAVRQDDWPAASLRDEARALSAWIAFDEERVELANALLLEFEPERSGPLRAIIDLLDCRAAIATGAFARVLARLWQTRGALDRQLGEASAWTLRAERTIASMLAASGELPAAAHACEVLRGRQTTVHGPSHTEVVRTVLLERECRIRFGGLADGNHVAAAVAVIVRSPANVRLLGQLDSVDASFGEQRPVIDRRRHVTTLDRTLQEASAQQNVLFQQGANLTGEPMEKLWGQIGTLRDKSLFPSELAYARAQQPLGTYLLLMARQAEERQNHHAVPKEPGIQLAKNAMSLLLDNPERVDRATRIYVTTIFYKSLVVERDLAKRDSSDLIPQLRTTLAEARNLRPEEDPDGRIYLSALKFLAASLGNDRGVEGARAALPLWMEFFERSPENGMHALWVAECSISARDVEVAETWLQRGTELLGERPAYLNFDWQYRDLLQQKLAELRAR